MMSPNINGHYHHRSCGGESSPDATVAGGGEIMLFGVRVKVDPMRKSVSLNNLSQYEQPNSNIGNNNESSKVVADEGYASANDAAHHQSSSGRERKRGVPWTEEEHKLFLLGLQKVGKGDWRGISRNFVKTRTPTQVASHAQKYFLRRSSLNRRRRRSSLFDITTDSVSAMQIEERENKQETPASMLPAVGTSKINAFPVSPLAVAVRPIMLPAHIEQGNQVMNPSLVRSVPMLSMPNSSTMNKSPIIESSSLSLRLSLSLDQDQSSSIRHSAFEGMTSFSNRESFISVV